VRAPALARQLGSRLQRRARGLRHRARALRRPAVAGPLALIVALTGLYGVQYQRARDRLADTRERLEQAQTDLAGLRVDLVGTGSETAAVHQEVGLTREQIEDALAAIQFIEATVVNVYSQVVEVQEGRETVADARSVVAASAEVTQACFAGVSLAVEASRRGSGSEVVEALDDAAAACTEVLAYATGARFPYDFPDPFVLRAGGSYYGYSTNSGAGDIQVIRSSDLTHWELVGNGLASLPGWAAANATWAPAVLPRPGGYVAYYTVRDAGSGQQCISRAVAASPAGPFVDDSAAPLVCQRDHGGSIDPSPFVDADGRAYLLWKSEGGGATVPTLWSQELTPDGLALTGPAHALLSVDRGFEHGVVEAPSMVRTGAGYVLVYAGADWNARSYTAAYATCAGPAGPCTKPADGRVLTSGSRLAGPGGVELFRDGNGALWAAFHAFTEPNVGYPSSRYLHIARAHESGSGLSIDADT
jgi:Glycosyl hydrolases family 43